MPKLKCKKRTIDGVEMIRYEGDDLWQAGK